MLYIVPTPIGNLEDITLRALKLFEEVEIMLTENSKNTALLLAHLKVNNRPKFVNILKNRKFNISEINQVLEQSKLDPDKKILLVVDAGTPGISDPAIQVVRLARQKQIVISTLPGATALIPAVVNSSLVTKEFLFLGFLPTKKGRQKLWKEIQNSQYPVVLYESVHRTEKLISEMQTYLNSSRKVAFSREISKLFEQNWVGTVADLAHIKITSKGEFVWIIEGNREL